MSITIELLVIIGLILLSGVFAAAEVAILTARRNLLERPQAKGKTSQAALDVVSNPALYVPTIQLARTLLLAIASAAGGVMLTSPLSAWLAGSSIPPLAKFHAAIALTVVVLCLAFVALLFGEFIPKQIARSNAETIMLRLARPIVALRTLARPLTLLVDAISHLVLRCCGFRRPKAQAICLEDIEQMIRMGGHQGILDAAEQMLARRALRLGDRTVRDIMHPRIEIDALDVDTPPDEVIGAVAMAGFSRLPIHEGDLDHIIGFVYTKDLLLRQHMGWPIELRRLVRPALLVPESLSIGKLLESFRLKRTQMAIVLDEFGGTEGLVTMEDVLEELVGEIHDEHRGERQHAIVARDESSWYVDGGMPLHELLERLDMAELRAALPADISTVAGLVLSLLGRIPAAGDCCACGGLTLEVSVMEGRRLDRVLIRRAS